MIIINSDKTDNFQSDNPPEQNSPLTQYPIITSAHTKYLITVAHFKIKNSGVFAFQVVLGSNLYRFAA